jgi:hypothetical protein
MQSSTSRSWKMERASVTRSGAARPRSNKYSKSDAHPRPAAGSRSRVWVGGYVRNDGIQVEGHYRRATAK